MPPPDTEATAKTLTLAALRGDYQALMLTLATTDDRDVRTAAGQALAGMAELLVAAAPGQLPLIVRTIRDTPVKDHP
ncbi:hypothetical protein [Streptomyces sp. NPDC049887]|uniref:hypothetical protein n=1 Tax=Streptomyces sp. NPDC049887 TaxID=3155654 RepID=UPI00344963BF